MRKQLFLEDLKGMSHEEVKEHIKNEYETELVNDYDIIIAYESVGSWGCDSSSFTLMKNKFDGLLYATYGSHCSCYGFEDQFEPEFTSLEYLKSKHFYFHCGGYDDNETLNQKLVKEFIANDLDAWVKE